MHIPGFQGIAPFEALRRGVKDFFDDQMLTYAAALSYHLMLALFPFVIFLLTVLGAFGRQEFFDWLLEQARLALPADAAGLVRDVIGEIRSQSRGGLLSFSILFAIWAASAGVRSVMTALNVAYDVDESRPAWKRLPLSVVYTLGLAALLITASAIMLLGPNLAQWLAGQVGLAPAVAIIWSIVRWPIAVVLLLATVAVIYYVAPNLKQPFRFVTPGSVIAVVVWIIASVAFSYYVNTFANYSATYGSLGGIVILLIYFFVSSAVLLFGAEINAAILELATRRDDAQDAARQARAATEAPDKSRAMPTAATR